MQTVPERRGAAGGIPATLNVARADARRGWRGLLLMGVLAGIVGAVVLATVVGARRTATAADRARAAVNYPQAEVRAYGQSWDVVEAIRALPQVERAWQGTIPVGRVLTTYDWFYPFVGYERPSDFYEPLLVEGRLPDPAAVDEVYVTEATARTPGYGVGDVVEFGVYTQDDFARVLSEYTLDPSGPRFALHIVGVVRSPLDLSVGAQKFFFGTPALARATDDVSGTRGLYVKVAGGDQELDEFLAQARAIAARSGRVDGSATVVVIDERPDVARFERGPLRVVLIGLASFALIVLVAGAVTFAQVFSRSLTRPMADHASLRALGFSRGQRILALAWPGLAIAGSAAVVSVGGAVALSPVFPLGRVRIIEPSPGVEVNIAVLLAGAAGVVAVTMGLIVAVATSRTRPASFSSRAEGAGPGLLRRLGADPAQLVGVRMALAPGTGRAAMPVRATLAAIGVALGGAIAVVTFSHSAARTVEQPLRYGVAGDLSLEFGSDDSAAGAEAIAAIDGVAATGRSLSAATSVDGVSTFAFAIEPTKGEFPLPMLSGREPDRPDEVVIGPALAAELGVGIGDRVTLDGSGDDRAGSRGTTAAGTSQDLLVVGTALAPTSEGDDYAGQVWVTPAAFRSLHPDVPVGLVILRYAPGADRDAIVAELDRRYPAGVTDESPPYVPGPVRSVGQLQGLLVALGWFLGALALAAVANAVVTGLRGRGQDVAVLRTLGFSSGQTIRSVLWMAVTTVGAGLVIGVPAGLLAGTILWRRTARGLDVTTSVLVPGLQVLGIVVVFLAAAVVVALVPARRVARKHPAAMIRAE